MKIKKGLWLILAITTVLLLAACKPKTVTIKFHTNGGTPLEEVSIRQKTTYEEPEIERTGYDFLGWYETANFTESSRFTFGGPINRNLVLYAKWQINSYQIAFFPDNGETIADMTVNFDANLTLPTPTKTGYQFSGWYIGSVTGQRFNATKMPAEDLQLYAKWTIKSYDVTFYVYDEVYITKTVDHGETLTDIPAVPAKVGKIRSWDRTDFTNITENIEVNLIEDDAFYTVTIKDDFGHVYETLTVKHGDPFAPTITPEKVGYDFVGYNPGLGTIITGDTEINVVYQQIFYRVIFRDHLSTPIVSVNVAHGNSATPPEFTPPEGYDFIGWSEDLTAITEDLVIDAVVSLKTYPFILHANDGQFANNSDTLSTTYAYQAVIGIPESPTRVGYQFGGWYLDDGTFNEVFAFSPSTTMPHESLELYAQWHLRNYNITYHNLEGTIQTNPATFNIETATITLTAPTNRTGYHFVGWFDALLGGNEITTIDKGTINNQTLYARWTPIEYTVTYENLSGTTHTNPNAFTIETPTIHLLNPTAKEGHAFLGWFTALNGGSQVTKIDEGSTGNKTLYARFEATTYTITYDLAGGNGPVSLDVTYGEPFALGVATKTGYSFMGWTYLGNPFVSGVWTLTNHITLLATYTEDSYLITYENLNGTLANNPASYNIETPTIVLADPSNRDGYDFVGWFTHNVGGTQVTQIEMGSMGHVTLYARWSPITYTITYKNIFALNANNPATYQITSATIHLANPENRIGFTFGGWFDALNGGNQVEKIENGSFGDISIYARWIPIDYSITYSNLNDTTTDNPVIYNIRTETFNLTDPTVRTGYNFVGWYTALSGGSKVTSVAQGTTGNKIFYARWEAIEYDITYDNLYDLNSNNPTIYQITSATITLVNPANRLGYTFDGWFDAPIGGDQVEEIENGSFGHVSLYARWTPINYTITYSNRNGTTTDNPTTYNIETPTITLDDPTVRIGYDFVGWFDALSGGNKVEEILIGSNGNKTLYARFEAKTYTITYDLDGGTGPVSLNVTYDANFTLGVATKAGFTFKGWTYLGNPFVSGKWNLDTDITIIAVYTPVVYTITYNDPEGIGHANPLTYHIESATITLVDPENRDGYNFLGWFNVSNQEVEEIVTGSMGNLVLHATWETIDYTIHYENLYGLASNNPANYHIETATITLGNPANRVGYTFVGWFDAPVGGNQVEEIENGSLGDLTIYARWSPINYTITYGNLNGTTTDNPTTYNIETPTITLDDPTVRIGYDFVGWFDALVGGNQVEEIEEGSTGNKTIYARFEAKAYTITYDLDGGDGPASLNVTYDANFTLGVATKAGFTFKGWTYSGNPFVSGIWQIDDNITIIASWTEWPVISFNANGGTGTASISEEPGTAIAAPNSPTRVGYTFVHWFDADDSLAYVFTLMPAVDLTLNAKWAPIEYTISYENLNGTLTNNPGVYDIETDTINLSDPTERTGYTFVGWYDEEVGGNQVEEIEIGSHGNLTLYARFEAKSYTITYNLSGGSGPASLSVTYDENFTLGVATKNGYIFNGWTYLGNPFVSGKWSIDSDITIIATYTPINYTITYNDLFGTTQSNPATYNIETATITLTNPTERTGYEFIGWYTHNVGGAKVTEITQGSTGNKVVYARWEIVTYNITYKNLFSLAPNNPATYDIETATIELVNPENRDGYTFVGWYDEEIGGNQVTQVVQGSHGNLILYARFEAKSYTITYDLDGGTGPASLNVTYDENFTLGVASKDGYDFDGWTYSGNPFASGKWQIAANITIKAAYSVITYDIAYENLFSLASNNPVTYTIETATINLANPEGRTGYTFVGWYDEEVDGNKVTQIITGSTEDITLYARWSAISYTISYENLFDLDSNNPATYTIETATINLANPEDKTGYNFVGWYDEEVGGNQVEEIEIGSHGNLTLYARFEAKSYTITYNLSGGSGPASLSVTYDENFTLGVATKNGYTFNGWTYLGNPFVSGKWSIDSDITIIATYTPINYTITYNDLFGTTQSNPATYNIETATITLTDPAVRTGYTFTGWFDGSNQEVEEIVLGSTGNLILYAKWSVVDYDIDYQNLNGTTTDNPLTYNITTATITLDSPTLRTGYDFVGWYDALAGGNKVTQIVLGSHGNKTLYARWELTEFTITYNNLFDLDHNNPETYTLDTATITLVNPDPRDHYTFDGWFDALEGGNQVTTIVKGSHGNKVLYARWTPVQYSINYENLFDTVNSNTVSYNIEDSFQLTDPTMRTGYRFIGWFDDLDSGNRVLEFTLGTYGNKTLYARWEIAYYDISGTFVYTAYDISNDQTEIEETISTEDSQAFFIPQILHGTMISPVTEQEGYIFSKFEYLGNTYTDIEELITVVNDIVLEDLTVYYMRIILEVAFTQKNPDYNSLQDPPALEYMTEIRYVYYNSNLDQNNIPELHNEDLDITALWERSVFNNIKVTTDVSALYFSSAPITIRFKDGSSIIFIASLGEQNPAENFITTASLLWSLNRSGYKFLGWYYMDGGVETKLNIGNYNYNYFAGNQTEIYTKWELLPAYDQPQNVDVSVDGSNNITITWELDIDDLAVPEFLFVIDKVVIDNYVTAVVRNGLEYTLTINSGSPDHPLFASLTEVGLHSVQIQALGDNQNSVNGIASEEYIYEELSIYETPPEAVNVYNYFIIEEYQESTRYIFYTNMTYQFSEGYIFEILTGSALVTAVDDHIIQMNNISGEFRFKLTKPDQSFVIYDALVIKDVKQFVFGSNYQTYLRETDSETSSYKLIDAPYYVGTGNDYYLDIRMTNTLGNRIPIDNVYLDYEVYLYSGGGYEVIQDISTHLTFKPNNRIEFKPAANGNTYKIVIKPKYQSTNMAVSPLTYEFTVNDGVNVFTHQELKQAFEDDEVQMINLHANIAPILSASQLNPDGSPINKKDLEGNVYNRKFNAQQQDNLVIQGNYMTINGSQLPYSNARSGSTIVGFAEAFEIINVQIAIFNYSVNDNENNWISNLTMNNLSIIGNTTVPSVNFGGTAEEILLQERLMSRNSGGYIGVMVSHGSSNFNNMQVKFSVIGFSNYAYGEDVEMTLNHVIVDDSWANSVYMQGATETTLTNSYFGQSGGPAFHVSDSRQSAGINNPVFNIIDTEIENYISGEEAWFKAYGMSAVALQLKSAIETGIAPTGRSIIKLVTHPITGVQTEMINLILLTEPHSGAKEVDGQENVIGGSEVVINVEGTVLARPYNYLLWPDPRINEGQFAFPIGLYSDLNDLDSLGTNIGTYAFTEYEKALSEGEIGQLVQLAAFYNFTHVQIVDAYKDAGYNMNNIANQIGMKIFLEGINPPQYFEVLSPLPVFPDGYAIVIIELQ